MALDALGHGVSAQGQAALDYARRGWPVFPCHAPVSGACSCGVGAGCASPAKHPRTRRGLHDATTDDAVVARWWKAWPAANVGLRTGAGLVVLDVDPAHGGMEALGDLEAAHGRLPETLVVRTGGAGRHLYFAADGPVRNSAGALGPGLDIRGDGGYVIAPPSQHASGSSYCWSTSAPLAPLPAWILQRLARPEPPRRPVDPASFRPGPGASAWAATALAGEVQRVASAAEGQRNHSLNRSAFVLGQIVGGGHLDREEVAELLRRAGEAAGLGSHESAATVASGLAAGERWPRHPRQRPEPGIRPATGVNRPPPLPAPEQAGNGDADRSDRPLRLPGRPGAPPSLAAFVEDCADRLRRPDGKEIYRWLTAARGLPEEVLVANRVGADPGMRSQSRPGGMPAAGPAAVLPFMEAGEAVFAQLCPLRPTPGQPRLLNPAARLAPIPELGLAEPLRPVGPCMVVTAGALDALSACAAGFRAAAVLGGGVPGNVVGDVRAVAERLCGLGVPLVLAFHNGPGSQGSAGLRAALLDRGARVARLHVPVGAEDLNAWMLRSRDWPLAMASAVRTAWTCEQRPRHLAR